MKELSSKDYYIEKELSEKHSLECRIYNAYSQLNYHESIFLLTLWTYLYIIINVV